MKRLLFLCLIIISLSSYAQYPDTLIVNQFVSDSTYLIDSVFYEDITPDLWYYDDWMDSVGTDNELYRMQYMISDKGIYKRRYMLFMLNSDTLISHDFNSKLKEKKDKKDKKDK